MKRLSEREKVETWQKRQACDTTSCETDWGSEWTDRNNTDDRGKKGIRSNTSPISRVEWIEWWRDKDKRDKLEKKSSNSLSIKSKYRKTNVFTIKSILVETGHEWGGHQEHLERNFDTRLTLQAWLVFQMRMNKRKDLHQNQQECLWFLPNDWTQDQIHHLDSPSPSIQSILWVLLRNNP